MATNTTTEEVTANEIEEREAIQISAYEFKNLIFELVTGMRPTTCFLPSVICSITPLVLGVGFADLLSQIIWKVWL